MSRHAVHRTSQPAAGDCSGPQDHRARLGPARSLAGCLLRRGCGPRRQLPDGRRGRGGRGGGHRGQGRSGLRHQHGFRQTRFHPHRRTRPRGLAAQHRAVALRRGRRAAVVVRLAPRSGIEDGEPCPGRLRGPLGGGPAPLRMPGPEPRSRHPRPGLRRRLRRPGALVASHGRADRRRGVLARGPAPPRRRGARGSRARAARTRAQGGPGPVERHPGLDRAGPGRPVRNRTGVPGRSRHGRTECRRCPGLRRPLRSPHPGSAPPTGADRGCGRVAHARRRQRHPGLAPHGGRPRAGPIACAASRR